MTFQINYAMLYFQVEDTTGAGWAGGGGGGGAPLDQNLQLT